MVRGMGTTEHFVPAHWEVLPTWDHDAPDDVASLAAAA
jgi:hypothetical protein